MIGGPVRNALVKIVTAATAGIAAIISTARMAFAANADASLPPEYNEM